ncbi:hypothetical protein K2173_028248 [Erythroxylum novogranatense]|uniref:BHLH domain-containing protein n=1 Tax=Erythroxylum novogranatense TaxID=1862640 RepID=A0AAV8U2M4_9ROSI|nr:hypothetical protein K2173_028248 [Erythroxylum novogranatense]
MAGFPADLQSFRHSFPFSDIDQSMETITQFTEINGDMLDNSSLSCHNFMPYSNLNFYTQQAPEFPGNLTENLHAVFHQSGSNQNVLPVSKPIGSPANESETLDGGKRKAKVVSESSPMNSSPQVSESGIKRKSLQSSRSGKRLKNNDEEKPKEVVHVRARRGQATDSHSLAERVRRGKINERLRCLQDIVPGCRKTMGMAVMLDEIINYVQSLQSQVEFLSMKLTAASTFYDFNAEPDAVETLQRTKAREAKEMERLMTERYGGHGFFHSTWSI